MVEVGHWPIQWRGDWDEDVFHDQGSAMIMMAHSAPIVYIVCHVNVLDK
jgi:hypothetical protein